VRALLVPAVIGLVGTFSGWPGGRLRRRLARRRRPEADGRSGS
jgi:hypothetical protein